MLLLLTWLIIGIGLLLFSADRFIVGAKQIAFHLGLSPLVIGLTVVSVGTAIPEVLVASIAAIHQQPDLVVGSAIGSNITNIGLGIGLIALVTPLNVHSDLLRRTYPLLFITMLILSFCLFDRVLSRFEGIILILTFILMMIYFFHIQTTRSTLHPKKSTPNYSMRIAIGWLILGGIIMPIAAEILVLTATKLAHYFRISQLVIGLTVVAIGTSLPEVAIVFVGVIRKSHDISLGNIIGSNISNLLLVLGLPAIITPIQVVPIGLYRDYSVMVGLTLMLFCMSCRFQKQNRINRIEGGLLLLCYIAYLAILYYQTN